jgi:hypothetical protein
MASLIVTDGGKERHALRLKREELLAVKRALGIFLNEEAPRTLLAKPTAAYMAAARVYEAIFKYLGDKA